ncbi:MAG: GxxExxY protein [Candidatus Aureabacteria bacterium]|nr:GxxExxY protein [Candidatus Auribacterota bacterium]
MTINLLDTTKSTKNTKILYKEESYKITGACFKVYKDKGPGFLEAVYQECLKIEFEHQNIPFIEKPKLEIKKQRKEIRFIDKLWALSKVRLEARMA